MCVCACTRAPPNHNTIHRSLTCAGDVRIDTLVIAERLSMLVVTQAATCLRRP